MIKDICAIIRERWRFRQTNHPFVYNVKTGMGIACEQYFPFRDEVRIRYSQYGYVNSWQVVSRGTYLGIVETYTCENIEFNSNV